MMCVVIKGPTFEEAHQQMMKAVAYADLVELRLDCFESLDLNALTRLRTHFSIPMIFTLRSQIQGGNYAQSEEHRQADIRRLILLKPEYFDFENHVPQGFIEELSSHSPELKLILSYHNFTETPEDLEKIYQEMRTLPAYFYKMAVTAKNSIDALRFMCWAKQSDDRLIAISMGSHGQISRILSPLLGSPITYAALEDDDPLAPGQLSANTLIERYQHRSLNLHTALYGLIGDPIDKSISDETHNHLFNTCSLDAVYIKIQVTPSELPDFLHLAKQVPFHGLSVTMPLKEHILPLLDEIDSQSLDIGAVNTLLFREGKIIGFNTDGIGALNAIEEQGSVKDKHIVIIGAGGATKAIAYEALQRGGHVTLINRDERKGFQLAERLHCIGKGLDYMATCAELGYDILINCTPSPLPISPDYILPQATVMDISTWPKETTLLKIAKEKGCSVIYGYHMFVEQALGQFNLWFNYHLDIQNSRTILEIKAKECVSGHTT